MQIPIKFIKRNKIKVALSRSLLISLVVMIAFVAYTPIQVLADKNKEDQSEDVTFLEPLNDGSKNANFDRSLTEFLTISIYQNTESGWTPTEELTAEGKSSEKLRLAGNHYHVNWHKLVASERQKIPNGKDTAPGQIKKSGDSANGKLTGGEYKIDTSVAGLLIDSLEITFTKNNKNTGAPEEDTVVLSERGGVPIKFVINNNAVVRTRVLTEQGFSASDIAQVLLEEFGLTDEQTAQLLYNELHDAPSIALALKVNYGIGAEEGAGVLKNVGFPIDDIHGALKITWEYLTTNDIMQILKDVGYYAPEIADFLGRILEWGAEPAAELLRNIGFPIDDIYGALDTTWEYLTTNDIMQILKDIGYGASEIGMFLKGFLGWAAVPVAELLKSLNFPIDDIYGALDTAWEYLTTNDIMQILKDVGYYAPEIADFLGRVLMWGAEPTAELLRSIGFPIDDIYGALDTAWEYLTTTEIMQILKDIGYGASEIADFLKEGLGWTAEQVGQILKDIGYGFEEISDILVALYNVSAPILSGILQKLGATVVETGELLHSIFDLSTDALADILALNFGFDEIEEYFTDIGEGFKDWWDSWWPF